MKYSEVSPHVRALSCDRAGQAAAAATEITISFFTSSYNAGRVSGTACILASVLLPELY